MFSTGMNSLSKAITAMIGWVMVFISGKTAIKEHLNGLQERKQRAKIRVEFAGTAHTMDLSFQDIERK